MCRYFKNKKNKKLFKLKRWVGDANGENFEAETFFRNLTQLQTFFFAHEARNGRTQSAVNAAPTISPRMKAPAIHALSIVNSSLSR